MTSAINNADGLIVDWEWLRPDSMPSCRHSVYASGTPELALEQLAERRILALLFSPGLRPKELEELRQQSQLIQKLCAHVQEHSTLWPTASVAPNATSGELFFELLGSALYRLDPLTAVEARKPLTVITCYVCWGCAVSG